MVIILPILMKKEINYKNFLDDQNIEIPPLEKFQKLGDDLGSLMINSKGQLHRHGYERGILLYGLIAKNKPDTVLEIGTGLGYSTLCMAWAMAENNIPGTIFTVDRYSLDVLQKRFYFSEKTNVPKIEFSSNHECWSKIAPENWLNKITPLTGYSGKILKNSKLPKIKFALIDGAHNYDGVKHDFYSLLNIMHDEFTVLFDDYIERPHYGVVKFVNEEIMPNFETFVIHTSKILINSGEEKQSKMVWINSASSKKHLDILFGKNKDDFLTKYRRYEKFIMIPRQKLNQKIPFLEKIKFRWWKT